MGLRILIVGPIPPQPGGGPISRGQLVAAFAKAGEEVCVVAPITAEALTGGDRYAAAHPEVGVVRYLVPFHETTPHRPPAEQYANAERSAIEALVGELAVSFEPDVLVAGREILARYIPALARRHALPAVLLARGNPTGHILDGRYPSDDAKIVVAGFRQFERIISVADYMTEGLRRLGCANVTTVPNAIDMMAFTRRAPSDDLRAELRIPTGSPVVLAPGHINQRKRPLDVVRSAAQVLSKRPDVTYVMAGVGVQREEVERLCRDIGIEANFRFPGWLDYGRMPDLVNLADIVVLASEAEGMARSYLEAMACERVLAASDIPPARELIIDGENALLFRLGDVEHMAQRTLEALEDPALRERLGRQARRSVEWRTLDRVVPLYLDEFRLAMNSARSRGISATDLPTGPWRPFSRRGT